MIVSGSQPPAPPTRTRQKLPARPREREGVWSLCAGTQGRSFTSYAQLSSCHKEKIDDWPRGGLAGLRPDYGAKSELRSGNLQGIVSTKEGLLPPQTPTVHNLGLGQAWEWLADGLTPQTDTS